MGMRINSSTRRSGVSVSDTLLRGSVTRTHIDRPRCTRSPRRTTSSLRALFLLTRTTVMATLRSSRPPIEIVPPPLGSMEERERRLIEAAVALTRSLRDERDRLALRLQEIDAELRRLASSLDARGDAADVIDSVTAPETAVRAAGPRRPSRTTA